MSGPTLNDRIFAAMCADATELPAGKRRGPSKKRRHKQMSNRARSCAIALAAKLKKIDARKAAMTACLLLALVGPAAGHEAPSGWQYPVQCCGGGPAGDCAPLPANALEPTPTGWRVIATGETIPYGMARASGDNQNHRCRAVRSDMNSKTRQSRDVEGAYYCLFVAPPGG